VIIEPSSARAFEVASGRRLVIRDVAGAQVADVVCFTRGDLGEYVSQARTRVNNWTTRITTGATLYSNCNNPLLRIVEDTVGVHDLLFPGCNRYAYEVLLGAGARDGCFENLGRALAPFGVSPRLVTDPFNVFMNTRIGEQHDLVIERAPSKPGDYVVLETLSDCVFGVSACADDVTECNGGVCTPIAAEIL
jgi:uncharacterized protein YcgI (DUF1989 family)